MNYAKRFKEERERLGFSQPAFGALIDVGKTTVINWEKGASAPDIVQVMALAVHGVDALYIITGKRSMAVAEVALLPTDERGLVDSYRRCSIAAKKSLLSTAALLAAGADQPVHGINMRAGNNSKQVGTINTKGNVTF